MRRTGSTKCSSTDEEDPLSQAVCDLGENLDESSNERLAVLPEQFVRGSLEDIAAIARTFPASNWPVVLQTLKAVQDSKERARKLVTVELFKDEAKALVRSHYWGRDPRDAKESDALRRGEEWLYEQLGRAVFPGEFEGSASALVGGRCSPR